jgi:tetratricopeptide (TPR) repeat protein
VRPRRERTAGAGISRTAALAIAFVWAAGTAAFYEWGGAAGRGVRELKQGRNSEAIRSLGEGRSELPRSAAVPYDQGIAFGRVGMADSATQAYREALGLRGAAARSAAAYNLGNAAMRADRFGEAAGRYRESLRIDPTRLDAKKNLEEAIRRMRRDQPKPPPSQGGGGSGAPQPSGGGGDSSRPPGQEPPPPRPGSSPPAGSANQPPGSQLGGAVPDRAEAEHWLDALEAERKSARLRDRRGGDRGTGQRDW